MCKSTNNKIKRLALALCSLLLVVCVAAQGTTTPFADASLPASGTMVLVPSSPGTTVYNGGGATIDASNASEGYVTIKYSGPTRAKVRITRTDSTKTYTYDLRSDGVYEVYPFTNGDGTYQVHVYYCVIGDQYALALGQDIRVTLKDAMFPFLYPNQFVSFSADSATVKKAAELTGGSTDQLTVIANIYNHVIGSVGYDSDKASAVKEGKLNGYVPKVDTILASGKGICFDYAALMTAMLRSQGIPTRMEIGYVSGGIYHAWISTYITGVGWVNGAIQFDGTTWKLMDPTFASSSKSNNEIMQFIGDGRNYQTVYMY